MQMLRGPCCCFFSERSEPMHSVYEIETEGSWRMANSQWFCIFEQQQKKNPLPKIKIKNDKLTLRWTVT